MLSVNVRNGTVKKKTLKGPSFFMFQCLDVEVCSLEALRLAYLSLHWMLSVARAEPD